MKKLILFAILVIGVLLLTRTIQAKKNRLYLTEINEENYFSGKIIDWCKYQGENGRYCKDYYESQLLNNKINAYWTDQWESCQTFVRDNENEEELCSGAILNTEIMLDQSTLRIRKLTWIGELGIASDGCFKSSLILNGAWFEVCSSEITIES